MSATTHRQAQARYACSSSFASSHPQYASSAPADSYCQGMGAYHPPAAAVAVLRCMRCARTVEATTTDDFTSTGMVRVGHNIYYCRRCAKLVGYK